MESSYGREMELCGFGVVYGYAAEMYLYNISTYSMRVRSTMESVRYVHTSCIEL